jgi:hypothetical protein
VKPTNFRATACHGVLTGVPGLNSPPTCGRRTSASTPDRATSKGAQNTLGVLGSDNAGF